MTISEACLLLGIDPDAGASAAKRAHRQRSQLLHPDRVSDSSPAVQDEAGRAMSQLNVALQVYLQSVKGQPDRGKSSSSHPRNDPPSTERQHEATPEDTTMSDSPTDTVLMPILKHGVLFWLALWFVIFIVRDEWTVVTNGAPALMILAWPLGIAQTVVSLMLLITLVRALFTLIKNWNRATG